ncbi:acetylxylan esterase [Brachybacterium sp. P6-10-X1]|uniref:acetylxylan esterase n=1 Tax=Brachybacterium sp. P6-10-X1 TaxID=1903186 RepID=UPI0012FBB59A|nr:acetylxylan esterase [Brachybacterium sp. P6-10-X1]
MSSGARRQHLRSLLGLPEAAGDRPPAALARGGPTSGAEPADGPLHAAEASPHTADGVAPRVVDETSIRTAAGDEIPAFLLRPSSDRDTGAGVVLIAGHGRGIDDLVAVDPVDEYHDGLAHKFVSAGFTVLCPEMISFGRRRFPLPEGSAPYADTESSCGVDAVRHLMHGPPLMGARVSDALAAVDALRQLDGVDPQRVAVAGGSGGGAVSLLAAAVDSSISAALVATYFCSFAASLCSIRHCPCNIIPGILPETEMADIAALVAPRPLILEAGERDHIFPIGATRASFVQLAPAWETHGAVPPELVVTDGGHAFRAERSLQALAERLA